jgi:hypothetical protein
MVQKQTTKLWETHFTFIRKHVLRYVQTTVKFTFYFSENQNPKSEKLTYYPTQQLRYRKPSHN